MIVLSSDACIHIIQKTDPGYAMRKLMLKGEQCLLPSSLPCAIQNDAAHLYSEGRYSLEQARLLVSYALKLGDLQPALSTEDIHRALDLQLKYDISSGDAEACILALLRNATLFTTKRNVQEACLNEGINCLQSLDNLFPTCNK